MLLRREGTRRASGKEGRQVCALQRAKLGAARRGELLQDRRRRSEPEGCSERLVFFFQAEDGIRDIGVTGVQTCALPISRYASEIVAKVVKSAAANAENNHEMDADKLYISHIVANQGPTMKRFMPRAQEIGRASCRERV